MIRDHLLGKHTVGVYPLLPDETCWFLAVDFDKKSWQEDVAAFLRTCGEVGVHAALERSRSGKGEHIWMFFDRPISASLARKFGCAILTRSMERRHQIGLDSYDRLFPSQDTMPKGEFGNLIALPLQRVPAEKGNSVFINEVFEPYRPVDTSISNRKNPVGESGNHCPRGFPKWNHPWRSDQPGG